MAAGQNDAESFQGSSRADAEGATSPVGPDVLRVAQGKLQRSQRELRASLTCARRALAAWCDVTEDGAPYMKAIELTSRLEELVGQALDDVEDRISKAAA